ncbi:MAG: glycosyltransferase family 4 protein [Acidobacteriaceae bacterium]|jgi:glycosyltransferase involved in cell wall biosynthesis
MPEPHPSADSRPIVITEIEQFGGAERSVLALARWLDQRGLASHIVTYADHCNLASYATHPLTVVELKAVGTVKRLSALKAYFKSRPTGSPQPLLSGYQPALHATLAGMRGFHTLMHDTPSLFSDPATRSLKSRLRLGLSNRIVGVGLRSSGNTIVTSEYLKAECRKDFGVEAQIARMGGLTAPDAFRVRPVRSELRMLSVCRIEANKRIDWILRSLAGLERATPPLSARVNWRLDLAGKGPLIPELTDLAHSLGIADRVHFHGFVPDADLQRLYDQAHLFLMPAVQGYGIPAVESLQRGIPVLLHRESGVSDILLETPWATVISGGAETTTAALSTAIDGVLAGRHHAVPLPKLPTEDEWAAQVAHLCGWVK